MLELLVVIAVITVLIGMVLVAIGYSRRTLATRHTAAQLGNLKGMLAELDAANGLKNSPPAWLWWNRANNQIINAVDTARINNYSVDFWKSPSLVAGGGAVDALSVPGIVTTDHPADRNAQPAVINTTLAMTQLATLPANRTALQNVSQSQTFVPTRVEADQTGRIQTLDTGTTPALYTTGAQVQYNKRYYIGTGNLANPANPTPVPNSGSGGWADVTNSSGRIAPMLLDGWGNPIIFVPASGLHVRLLNGNKTYKNDSGIWFGNTDFIVISPEGRVVKGTTNNPQDGTDPVVSQVGRPFFASAGPDGSFETGDDNVYSFEQ